jgi:spore coat polysaccharide biosynthesis predicted glycosyltransferase SpsG
MTRDPILFRVDGTSRTGHERLYRCLTYAAALQRRRRPCFFLSQVEPPPLAFALRRAGNDRVEALHPPGSPADLEQTLFEIRRINPAAVLVDAAEADDTYLRDLRAACPVVVSMDHVASVAFPSRLVINPLLGPGKEAYTFGRGTQLLLGARYALVRPEVRRARPIRSQEPPQPFRIMVALGDDDPANRSMDLARMLMNCPRVGRVDVVVRQHHPALEQFKEMAETYPGRFDLATEPAELTARLSRCHLAVTAGNSWSVELACVGLPQLIIVENEAHWPTARRLEEEQVAVCLGQHPNVSVQTIRQAVQDLLTDQAERQAMSRAGRRLIDGRGPDRLVTALEVLLHTKKQPQLPLAA